MRLWRATVLEGTDTGSDSETELHIQLLTDMLVGGFQVSLAGNAVVSTFCCSKYSLYAQCPHVDFSIFVFRLRCGVGTASQRKRCTSKDCTFCVQGVVLIYFECDGARGAAIQ